MYQTWITLEQFYWLPSNRYSSAPEISVQGLKQKSHSHTEKSL